MEDRGELLSIVIDDDDMSILEFFSPSSGGSSAKILRGLSSIGAMRGKAVEDLCNAYAGLFSSM